MVRLLLLTNLKPFFDNGFIEDVGIPNMLPLAVHLDFLCWAGRGGENLETDLSPNSPFPFGFGAWILYLDLDLGLSISLVNTRVPLQSKKFMESGLRFSFYIWTYNLIVRDKDIIFWGHLGPVPWGLVYKGGIEGRISKLCLNIYWGDF